MLESNKEKLRECEKKRIENQMKPKKKRESGFSRCLPVILVSIVLLAACIDGTPEEIPGTEPPESSESPVPATSPPTVPTTPSSTPSPTEPPKLDKMALWDTKTGPHLRGANIYQKRVYPELDGPEFMGPGPVGPPFTQKDFDRLSALGANYVNISHPGLFTETPPYTLDKDIQKNLDNLLDMIARADMFAVISFRTGPGRSEFTFMSGEVGTWFDESYLNDSVWQSQEAQDAWVAMWQYTAKRYRSNPIVAGYDLMVEPNSNETGADYLHDPLDIWDPEEFYSAYGDTLYDWNQLYPRIIEAIREVDKDTPILVGGNGYSGVAWLPYLRVVDDPRIVYTFHQYQPTQYTFQEYDSIQYSYPGRCDTDWDGEEEELDKAWLEDLLSIVDRFAATHKVEVAVNEYGVMRWVPGAAQFMDDEMALFEKMGLNYALWEWTTWEPFTEKVNSFNFRFGPDPENREDTDNELMDVITTYWGRNSVRPSTFNTALLFSVSTTCSSVLMPL